MAINTEEYKALYIKTAQDLVVTLEETLKKITDDPCDTAAIADFHRAAHTLKGQSLVMGYTKTGLGAKVLEHLFAAIKEEKECITPQNMPLIESVVGKLRQSLKQIAEGQGESDLSQQIEALANTTSIPLL